MTHEEITPYHEQGRRFPQENPYQVKTNQIEGWIRISRRSREMLYWESSEWEDDPNVVFVIAEAISLALNDPYKMDDKLIAMNKLRLLRRG